MGHGKNPKSVKGINLLLLRIIRGRFMVAFWRCQGKGSRIIVSNEQRQRIFSAFVGTCTKYWVFSISVGRVP
jgi:hypothetical protein